MSVEWFSGKYKKMCEEAKIIQDVWKSKPKHLKYWCERGDYEDGEIELEPILDPIATWEENYIWLPTKADLLREVILLLENDNFNKHRMKMYSDYVFTENKKLVDESQNREDTIRTLTLKFAMRLEGFEWDDENGEWVRK